MSHYNLQKCIYTVLNIIVLLTPLMTKADINSAQNSLIQAIANGTPNFLARYRFEHVNDDAQTGGVPLEDADASTIRVALGYTTDYFHHFNAGVEFEHISEVGPDDFNNGSNGKTQFATVVDPDGTELNQGWLGFNGLAKTTIKAGRQIITYRKAPLHRYLGTVLWRQNWQTHDAVTAEIKPVQHMKVNYGYSWQVNRIFGNDARSPLDKFDSNSHLINLQYDKFSQAKIEAYSYLLDFDNAAGFSTGTIGIRVHGKWPIAPAWKAHYGLEYAYQWDRADNPADINANYYLLSGGVSWKGNNFINSIKLTVHHEILSGDGGADRFVTILGTNHAFQGWADRFLVTPGDGIKDTYINFSATAMGAKFILAYHMLETDNDSYDYGNELDILLQKKFLKHYTLGAKYSNYDADRNILNVTRNPAQSADKSIFWLFGQFKY